MNPMPDEVTAMALQRLESQMTECNGRLQDLAKWLAGNGTVGIAEQVRNNAKEIKRLRTDLDDIRSASNVTDDRTRWQAIGRWAEVAAIAAAFVMSLASAMGWI